MKLTSFGHSCFSVETAGKHLLFDPFIRPNPLAAGVKVEDIRADFLFISHGHADHIADAVEIARRTGALVVANWEVCAWLNAQGVANTHPMNHGGTKTLPFGRVKMVAAVHSSSFPDGTYAGNPAGFVIESEEGNFYYSGDTALTYDMKLVGETTALDFAVFCIGDNFTMGPGDAIRAAEWVGTKVVVGVHYDTFPYIVIDSSAATELFRKAGLTLHLPRIGQALSV
ncbi:MAG: metal-dependent hydrolase [Candidatus Methylacidiphilales bacterium]|nr:metal-dependent hydrolase [Candidatus Methylacidiphilales bacterium]